MSRWTPDFGALLNGLHGWAGGLSGGLSGVFSGGPLGGLLGGLLGRPATTVLWLGPQGVVELAAAGANTGSGPGRAAAPVSSIPADFAGWCAAHTGQSCRVLLSSEYLALITTDPALALQGAEDLQAYAGTQFEQYHGSEARDWPLRLWRSAAGCGATAVRGGVLARLQAQAAAHRVRLISAHAGWAVLAPRLAPAAPSLLLLAEGNLVTAVVTVRGQTRRAALRRCPDDLAQQTRWALDLRSEWALDDDCRSRWIRVPQDLPPAMGGSALRPAADGDFTTTSNTQRLPRLAAAAAACIAVVAVLDTHGAWQQVQALQPAQTAPTPSPAPTAMEARGAAVARAPARPTTASSGPASREAEALLLAMLRQPWPAVFAASEAATQAQVHWLLFDHDGRALRLEATAPDLPTAWQAAATLGQQTGVAQAAVAHLQADGPAVRFELRADWVAASTSLPRQDGAR